MKKGLKILIASSMSLLTIGILITAIINFIILPPKVTGKAQKYRYNHNNILKLKSITVDGDRVIYEFGSSNKYFKKTYVETNGKEISLHNDYYLELFATENYQTIKGSEYNSNRYYIISTLTSNFLIVTLEDERETNSVKCFYVGQENESFDYLHISVSSGYEEPGISIIIDDLLENTSVVKYQTYDKEKKKWSEIEGWSDYYSHIVKDNGDSESRYYEICSLK